MSDDSITITELQSKTLASSGSLPAALVLYCTKNNIERPRVSDLLSAMAEYIPWYDTVGVPVIEALEGGEGPNSYPGGIPLAEHDLMHWIIGSNLVVWGDNNSKRTEGFLTGLQFSADLKFTREHKFKFAEEMKLLVAEGTIDAEYLYHGDRAAAYHAGFAIGRFWQKSTRKSLREFLTKAVQQDSYLDETVEAFYCIDGIEEKIRRQIELRFNETRRAVPEIFNPRRIMSLS